MATTTITEGSGERVFVIGDLHGCPAEPEVLLRFLEEKQGVSDDDLVVFLGDYIDRGPDSKRVVELALDFKAKFPKTRFLKGNHEDMMLDFLGFGGHLGQAFLYNGGLETIQSYGISVFAPPTEMVSAMPQEHFRFFCELESVLMVEDFVCVHAGLNPSLKLKEQNDNDVYWIRDDFLNNTHNFSKTVVFGHTPHQEVFIHFPYKLGLDTGLVFGNKLTCAEVKSGAIFEIAKDSQEVVSKTIDTKARVFK